MAQSTTRIDAGKSAAPYRDARAVALAGLGAVLRQHQPLDQALRLDGLEARDRAFARLLLLTMLRRLGQIDALLAACAERPLPPRAAPVRDILRLGAAQLLFLATPAHAAVSTSVEMTKKAGFAPFAALVNAVLRRLASDGEAMRSAQDEARINTPDWLWDSWIEAYGEDAARAIATAHLAEPPLDLTVRDDEGGWAARLGAKLLPTGSLRVANEGAIPGRAGFAEGAWWVQDAAAALPVRLFGDVAGLHVCDLCAAPGGKTLQLAAAGARVTALDVGTDRLMLVSKNLARLGLAAECVAADARVWRPPELFDAVLLDAPCSATGTIRRHPDVALLRRELDIAGLVRLQDELLKATVAMVTPGGMLVYSVCSLQPEEGVDRVARLLAAEASCERVPIAAEEVGGLAELVTPDGDLRTMPFHLASQGGMDGFYAARLRKKP